MRRAGIGFAVLATLSLSLLGGCGGGGDENGKDTAAGRAAQAYVDAYNSRDFKSVCGLLTESYKEEREIAGPSTDEEGVSRSGCPQYFEEHTSGAQTKLTLVDVQENAKVATAHIQAESQDAPGGPSDQVLGLQEQPDGSWLVTDVTSG
jgi:ketosteroid isomerase-like protein